VAVVTFSEASDFSLAAEIVACLFRGEAFRQWRRQDPHLKTRATANPELPVFRAASRRLILSLLHIRMESDLFDRFEYLLKQLFGAGGIEGGFHAPLEDRGRRK
jgi:hypothetical protein